MRKNYWHKTGTTNGFKWTLNPGYISAQYTVSIIFNPKVYKWLVPGALNSPGGMARFSTPNYFPATVEWKNIPNRDCNPDGTIGFYRAVLAMAAQPLHPNYGYVILHKVCSPELQETNCAAS